MNKSIARKVASSGVIISLVLTGCSQIGVQNFNDDINEKNNEIRIIQNLDFQNTPVSRGQVADLLLNAASNYNKGLDRKTIIKGYEDDEGKNASRAESLVMISRAFNTLHPPKGNNKNISDENVSFIDVPKWAKKDVDNLINGGVLSGTDDGKLNGDYPMRLEEINTVVRRIWAFKGTSLKDDFYNTINKNKVDGALASKGYENDLISKAELNNKEKVNSIIKEVVSGNHKKGSKEQKIKNMYFNITNMEYRNTLGNKPIKKYLDGINNSNNIEDLNKVQRIMLKELGYGGSLSPVLIKDFRDNSTYMLSIFSPMIPRSKEVYKDDNNEEIKSYRKYLTKLLILSGETKETAERNVKFYLELEEELAKASLSPKELEDSNNGSVIMEISELEKIIPEVEISKAIISNGYKLPKEVIIRDSKVFESYGKYLNNKNIDVLKTVTKITLLQKSSVYLSQEYLDAYNEYIKADNDDKSHEELALETISSSLQEYVGEIFVNKYFSKESKRDMEKTVRSIVKVYKDRIKRSGWLSSEAKKVAIKKLNKMKFVIGYFDPLKSPSDNLEIKGQENGGSYLENIAAVEINTLKEMAKNLGKEEGSEKLRVPAFESNTYYNPQSNTMVFPAGMFNFPVHNNTKKTEEILGGIGTIIAHEISHAFDSKGANYDQNGNEKNWWKESDYKKFESICKNVEHLYSGLESAPGITSDVEKTLEENISDIVGVACTLEIMSNMKNPDYNAFFISYGKTLSTVATRKDLEFLSIQGEESTANIRVNRVLSNFEEFYKTYNIQEGDGMYVDPKERVNVW